MSALKWAIVGFQCANTAHETHFVVREASTSECVISLNFYLFFSRKSYLYLFITRAAARPPARSMTASIAHGRTACASLWVWPRSGSAMDRGRFDREPRGGLHARARDCRMKAERPQILSSPTHAKRRTAGGLADGTVDARLRCPTRPIP